MSRNGRRSFALVACLGALGAGGCSGKVSKVGGESHFMCKTDDDCPRKAPVCVHLDRATPGSECRALDAVPGAGGQSSAPDAGAGSPGSAGAIGDGPGGSGPSSAGPSGDASSGTIEPLSEFCVAACCPTVSACYAVPAFSTYSPGAACLASHDNNGQEHVQLRQTWTRSVAPAGNAVPIVYSVRSGRSELPLGVPGTPDCHMGKGALGSGGYIELVDLDLQSGIATLGFAQFVSESTVGSALADGLCMLADSYVGESGYRLTDKEISESGNDWPEGLISPMGLSEVAWHVAPVRAKRLDADFDLAVDRLALLFELSQPRGSYANAGFSAVFFYDTAAGYFHSFAPLSWDVEYDQAGTTKIAVPVREAETKLTFNDPVLPNCIGAYGLDPSMTPAGGCTPPGDPTLGAAWGGGNCSRTTGNATCKSGEGPASTTGYSLVSELEQVFDPDLQLTLCVAYPTQSVATADGFYDDATHGCRTQKWDPTVFGDSGLPHGDWCAATNGPATATCHDAFRVKVFQTFSGAKIRLDSQGREPATCPFF